ncbi:MAG: RNA polymerase sigma factor [Hyphomicrobiales bacterium]
MADGDHKNVNRNAVTAGLPALLSRLWRFGMVLSRDPDSADELVQATCLRAIEKCDQFEPGTALDRWTFRILNSIWSNELRSRRVRLGQGQVDAELVLVSRDDRDIETRILASQVLKEVAALPEPQRAAVLLVYGEGLRCREAAEVLDVPEGTIMSRLSAARTALGHLKEAQTEAGPATDRQHRKA